MNTQDDEFGRPAPLAVDTRGAAALLGVSKAYLEKLRFLEAEHGPPFMRLGRKILYRVSDLEAFAETLLVEPARVRK
ncbi:MAG: helix-turn-helix domain-containing protein [Hyphomonadaceae bacterium]